MPGFAEKSCADFASRPLTLQAKVRFNVIHQPRTEAQIEASRRNGALSHGPVTEEGKAISSKNGLKDGLASNTVIIAGESKEKFDALLASQIAEFLPETDNEMLILQAMVVAKWMQMRVWGLTASGHSREIERQAQDAPELLQLDMPTRAHIAFAESDKTGAAIDKYFRYGTKFDREFHRQRRELLALQKNRNI